MPAKIKLNELVQSFDSQSTWLQASTTTASGGIGVGEPIVLGTCE